MNLRILTEDDYEELVAMIEAVSQDTRDKDDVVVLLAANWVTESGEKHSQVVTVDGVTENSQVDLTPTEDQLIIWREKELAFTTKNVGGVVTVYAIGQRPENDYTIPVTIREVR